MNPKGEIHTTFRVLDGPGYQIILGRQLLTQIHSVLDISERKLPYKIVEKNFTIATILDSAVKLKPVYQAV